MSEHDVVIDEPAVAEIDRIVELFVADMRDLGRQPDRATMRAVTAAMFDDHGTHLRVARVDGRIAGVLLANEFSSIKFPGRALWIEELYVDPSYRRLGLGRMLVEHMLDWAYEAGFAGVELEAYRMNTAASVLYRSIGFKRLARERYSFEMSDYLPEDEA